MFNKLHTLRTYFTLQRNTMKQIFNCVFAFFKKDLSTLYKEGSAVNFDAVSSNCFQILYNKFQAGYWRFIWCFCIHSAACTVIHKVSRAIAKRKEPSFFAFPKEILLPRERFIRKCHWEVHFRFSFLTAQVAHLTARINFPFIYLSTNQNFESFHVLLLCFN